MTDEERNVSHQKNVAIAVWTETVALVTMGVILCWFEIKLRSLSTEQRLEYFSGTNLSFTLAIIKASFLVLLGILIGCINFLDSSAFFDDLSSGVFKVFKYNCAACILITLLFLNVVGLDQKIGTTDKDLSYIVPEKAIQSRLNKSYKQAKPKDKFVEENVVISKRGYEKINKNTFRINGRDYKVEGPSNINIRRNFGGKEQIKTTTYTWKSSTPQYVRNAYHAQLGNLDSFNSIEITEN